MDFYDKDSYSLDDIKYLINNEVEENIHLDYKAAGALAKDDKKRTEITKDVSAFANSDGGIIVYGIAEYDYRPQEISPIDGRVYTKEWLENVIQLIQPRIEGLRIFPIRVEDIDKSIYLVQIPRSDNAPHMANDHRYYGRRNFQSLPLEDYEVKDLYNRMSIPKLKIDSCSFVLMNQKKEYGEYQLTAKIKNEGKNPCNVYKLNFYLNKYFFDDIKSSYRISDFTYTIINENRLKLGVSAQETIFPDETLDIGHLTIVVRKEVILKFWNDLVIDMILFYSGGQDQVAYIPSKDEYVEGKEEISRVLIEKSVE